MEEVSVFKAVSVSGTGFQSAFTWAPIGRLRYSIGEWTRATLPMAEIGYHPTVFLEERAARQFLEASVPVHLQLFRATGRGRVDKLPPRGYVHSGHGYVCPLPGGIANWPFGTAMFEEVRLDSFYGFINYNIFEPLCWVYELPIARS